MSEPFEEIYARVEKAMLQLAERIKLLLIRQVQQVLNEHHVNDTGTLRKSIDGKIERRTAEIILEIFSNTSYAEWVHEGTRPHYPPLYKIRDWVRRKGLAGKYSVKTHKRQGGRMSQYWEDDQIARRIAWKIAQKGTKGIKFFEIALKQAMPLIQPQIDGFKI